MSGLVRLGVDSNVSFHKNLQPEKPEEKTGVKKRKQIEADFLTTMISLLPQTSEITEKVNQHLWQLHSGKNITRIQRLFSRVLKKEQDIFVGKSSQEKAEILFHVYNQAFFCYLEKAKKLQKEISSLELELAEIVQEKVAINSAILQILKQETEISHNFILKLTIARALSIHPSGINLHSVSNQHINTFIDIAPFLVFFQKFFSKSDE